MRLNPPPTSAKRYWPALLSYLALVAIYLKPTQSDVLGKYLGGYLSGPLFVAYLGASAVLLWLQAARGPAGRGWWCLDFACSALLLVMSVKFLTSLPRPLEAPYGFPSGHSTLAFGFAWLVLEARPRLSWLAGLWFGMALLIAWSRVEVGAHFDYQVLAGAALGCALGWAVSHWPRGVLLPRLWSWSKR